MNQIEMKDILYTLAVERERSFSRAAEKYYISQPSLSKAVRKVERQLGTTVFDRRVVPLKLTADGEIIINAFTRMEEINNNLMAHFAERQKQLNNEIRLCASSFFCAHYLPPLLADFCLQNPDCRITLIESNDHDLREYLEADAVDIGISADRIELRDTVSFVLGSEELVLAVPAALPINEQFRRMALTKEEIKRGKLYENGTPCIPLDAFRDERFLFLKQGNDMYERGLRICAGFGFEPKIAMELDQLLTAYYLTEAGRGVAFIRSAIPKYVGFSETVCYYKVNHPDMVRDVYVTYHQERETENRTKALLRFLRTLKNL